ncbi:50S ribosomal protein L1 [Candidatus Fermentibacterales bacterium]|nr:50S ribosomal protein L1 [Candidatus Fermentibacterales bacterium]
MAGQGKRYRASLDAFDRQTEYPLGESMSIVKGLATAKFDETVEMAVYLSVDPKHSDQVVRGTCMLPHGTGKKVRVLVFARGDQAEAASEAGADFVGDEDLAAKIEGGWLDFDVVIATPDMMKVVGKLGRVLGPRGLMPNPKTGTVTDGVGKAVEDSKGGKISFRTDKTGNLHVPIGKASFEATQLEENAMAFLTRVQQLKPSGAKGRYIEAVTVCTTMSPGVRVDAADVRARLR